MCSSPTESSIPTLPKRLKAALDADERIEEVWIKSRGGDARAGNLAGKVIRTLSRHGHRASPKGWTCFSACNFLFMGGDRRFVDPGGVFMVHMFTHTGDRDTIEISVEEGSAETTRLIGQIEQDSALLASEDNDFLIRMGISAQAAHRSNVQAAGGRHRRRTRPRAIA